MEKRRGTKGRLAVGTAVMLSAVVGMAIGSFMPSGSAQMAAPTEHKGLKVETLGIVSAESMKAQLGLENHILLLRAITIEPGGQIAKHSAGSVPGLVKVVSGAWTEGTENGETVYSADGDEIIVENENTVHWFYNRGDEPATAYVCDVKPAS